METLVTSTTPKTIVLGKTIGIGIVGLIQICILVATAIISAKAFLDPELINAILDVSKMTPYHLRQVNQLRQKHQFLIKSMNMNTV